MEYYCTLCVKHGGYYLGVQSAIEHLRRFHVSFIGRPGETNSQNHMWYCFDCDSDYKDHRSYNSDNAMWSHLEARNDVTCWMLPIDLKYVGDR